MELQVQPNKAARFPKYHWASADDLASGLLVRLNLRLHRQPVVSLNLIALAFIRALVTLPIEATVRRNALIYKVLSKVPFA